MILVVDTGPLVAAFNKKDRAHEVCAELLTTTSAQLIVPAPVLTEARWIKAPSHGFSSGGWSSVAVGRLTDAVVASGSSSHE